MVKSMLIVGSSTLIGIEELGIVEIGDRITDIEIFGSKHGNDLAGFYLMFDALFAESFKHIKFFDFRFQDGAVAFYEGDIVSCHQGSAEDAPYGDPAGIG